MTCDIRKDDQLTCSRSDNCSLLVHVRQKAPRDARIWLGYCYNQVRRGVFLISSYPRCLHECRHPRGLRCCGYYTILEQDVADFLRNAYCICKDNLHALIGQIGRVVIIGISAGFRQASPWTAPRRTTHCTISQHLSTLRRLSSQTSATTTCSLAVTSKDEILKSDQANQFFPNTFCQKLWRPLLAQLNDDGFISILYIL